jgi:rod shape-determining protein MreD
MTTPARAAAALAAIPTALLLQATLVAPASMSAQLSLPAVLVAAVAMQSGPGTGMSLGFATGLLADLGTGHPAGVLALCWMGLGLLCGLIVRPMAAQIVLIGVLCGVAGSVAVLLLTALGSSGATAASAAGAFLPTVLGDALLALIVSPVVRWFLRSDALRAPSVGHG